MEGSPAELLRWIKERSKGVPLAYLSHLKEFYGRRFYVDRRVLVPRPETEILVEEALSLGKELFGGKFTALDLGTGSGVIAVTLALEFPEARILASDISPDALEVARKNARMWKVEERISFLQGDLFSPLTEPVDAILANLPYVPEKYVKEHPELSFEPPLSLIGGETGKELVSRMLEEAASWLNSPGFLLAEKNGDSPYFFRVIKNSA
jgi:release factor glutamine methyltransferase